MRFTKISLLIAAIMIVFGLMLTAAALAATGGLPTPSPEVTTHTITDDFHSIAIDLDTTDVTFYPSQDHTCRIIFEEKDNLRHSTAVRNGTLLIGYDDGRQWYDFITLFGSGDIKAEIYLPEGQYESLMLEIDTGHVHMPGDFTFDTVEIETDTGDIHWQAHVSGRLSVSTDMGDVYLSDCHGAVLDLDTDTGDVYLSGAVFQKELAIETGTGDVIFDRADSEAIFVQTDTGDVSGTVLTDKVFHAFSDTGSIQVPWDTIGGSCKIITDTGDIHLTVAE